MTDPYGFPYDGNSNMTNYRTRAGVTMACTFDNRNRDTLCDWSDSTPDVTKTYDDAGRTLSISNSVAASTFTYDAANQLLSESITISGLSGAKTVAYTYDDDGNLATFTDPSGSVIAYSYTDRNQVASIVADGPPPLASFTYDLAGNRTSRSLENGIESIYTYDDDGRLTSLSHGASVETLTYTYDVMNRRTGETRSSGPARTFGYDLTGQLTAVNQSSGNATFAYDAVGNRTTVTGAPGAGSYTANNLNQYTSAGGVGSLTYDANGNLATGGGWTYTHNGNSRLVSVTGPGSVTASFGRDGRNRDVKRTINGTTTYLIYDDWNLVAEYDGSGVLTTRYIHGPQVDEILTKITSGDATYPLPDALGSTIAVTDESGDVLERVFYSDAFGTPTFEDASGTPLAGTSTGTKFLFTGREWIEELELYDYRNRTYSAELGRFIETDPIGFDGGDVNLYRYVFNDLVNYWDPLGLYSTKHEAGEAGAIHASRLTKENKRIEYCGRVCRKCKDGEVSFYYTGPVPGYSGDALKEIEERLGKKLRGACKPSSAPACDKGDDWVGDYHSHPYGSRHNNHDRDLADKNKRDSWVGRGGNKTDYYNHNSR